jgi:hypothetical protein
MNWTITYYSESVQAEILALPAGLLARYLRYSERMEVYMGRIWGCLTRGQWVSGFLNCG